MHTDKIYLEFPEAEWSVAEYECSGSAPAMPRAQRAGEGVNSWAGAACVPAGTRCFALLCTF